MLFVVILVGLSAVIIFGASPVAAKVAVLEIAALDVAVLRTVLGGFAVLPIILWSRIKLPESPSQRDLLLISGFCGFIAFPLVFTFGIRLTSANHASMILAILPMLTGGFAMAWDRQWPRLLWWCGCVIAITGEVVLIAPWQSMASTLHGDILVLISTVFAALGYVAGGRLQKSGYSASATTFWGVVLFALLLLPVTPWLLDFESLQQASIRVWLAVLFLAVVVTVVAYICWYWALGNGGIARIGLLQFLQPVSGVLLAGLLLAEKLDIGFAIASIVIMVGVIVAFRAR